MDWKQLLKNNTDERAEGYILYLRRSLKQKGKKALMEKLTDVDKISIEQQRDVCLHIAKERGLNIVGTFEEEETAMKPDKRPEFKKMMEYIAFQGKTVGILAWAPDRLTRNALEAGQIIQAYVQGNITDFQFATYYFRQDETGLEYLMMEFARAMGYSQRLSTNVRRGMYKGYYDAREWQFSPKFGYKRLLKRKPDGTVSRVNFMIPCEDAKEGTISEFEVVQTAFRLRLKGKSCADIAKYINERGGYTTKKGKVRKLIEQKLSGDSKGRKGILRDTFYYGLADSKFGKMSVENLTETDDQGNVLKFVPAVLETEFEICQKVNERKSKRKAETHEDLPFRMMLRCGHCREMMSPELKKKKYVYYYCHNKECSFLRSEKNIKKERSNITGTSLFPMIQELLVERFVLDKKELTAYLAYLEKQQQIVRETRSTDLKRIAASKGHITNLMEELDKDYAESIVEFRKDKAKIAAIDRKYDNDKKHLNDRFEAELKKERHINEANQAWTQDLAQWLELSQRAHQYWVKADFDQKRRIAENIFFELIIKDGQIAQIQCQEPYKFFENASLSYSGDPTGIRTPITRMKTWRPNP